MWYARRVVLFLVIECGESFRYRDYLANVTLSQVKIEYKFELKVFSEYKIEEIMTCITRSLYFCDELFILVKITFLLVIFELFVEPFLKLGIRAIYLLYRKHNFTQTITDNSTIQKT